MPSYTDHISQAKHNEGFGLFLKENLKYKDWLITVCFYTALHYVEAKFADSLSLHSENIPKIKKPATGKDENQYNSIHTYRKKLVATYLKKIYVNYRKLEENSKIARYLNIDQSGIALSFFTDQDALNMFDKELQLIKQELSFP